MKISPWMSVIVSHYEVRGTQTPEHGGKLENSAHKPIWGAENNSFQKAVWKFP